LFVAFFLGAPAGAHALISYNGADFTQDYEGQSRIRTCDRESDSTGVKGVYERYNGTTGSVLDDDGNNGICAHEGSGGSYIRGHRTCEAPEWRPDSCGNWQRY
jgi:hypothetical protein